MEHPDSPNGCWKRHGYRIERDGKRRKIFSPHGSLIFNHGPAGYEDEMEYIRKHGLLLTQQAA